MDPYYESPLTIAVKDNNSQIIGFLITAGAEPNEVDGTGFSPLYRAIICCKTAVLQAFLHSVDITNMVDAEGNTPLIAAIRHGSHINILYSLVGGGADVNETKNTKTPLAWTAEVGNLEAAYFLIRQGAIIDLICWDGNTALGTAIRCKKQEVAALLISQNAHPDLYCYPNGKSPLNWAVLNQDLDMTNWLLDRGAQIDPSAFLDAIELDNLELVQLLIQRGASVFGVASPTPLQRAVDLGFVEIATVLVQNGANLVMELRHQEVSKVMEFLDLGRIDMVTFMVENGARLNEMAECGETLLTKAVKECKYEMVKFFLEHGADGNKANWNGLTPLVIAESNNDFRTFQLLMQFGAQSTEAERDASWNLTSFHQVAQGSRKRKFQKK